MIRVYIYIYLDQTHYFFVTKRFPRLTMAVRGTPRINEIEQPRVERSFLHSSVKRTLKEFFFFPLFSPPRHVYAIRLWREERRKEQRRFCHAIFTSQPTDGGGEKSDKPFSNPVPFFILSRIVHGNLQPGNEIRFKTKLKEFPRLDFLF